MLVSVGVKAGNSTVGIAVTSHRILDTCRLQFLYITVIHIEEGDARVGIGCRVEYETGLPVGEPFFQPSPLGRVFLVRAASFPEGG